MTNQEALNLIFRVCLQAIIGIIVYQVGERRGYVKGWKDYLINQRFWLAHGKTWRVMEDGRLERVENE